MTITGPTWVYHRSGESRLIETQAQYDALGEGWADSPAAFYAEAAPSDEPTFAITQPRRRRPSEK